MGLASSGRRVVDKIVNMDPKPLWEVIQAMMSDPSLIKEIPPAMLAPLKVRYEEFQMGVNQAVW